MYIMLLFREVWLQDPPIPLLPSLTARTVTCFGGLDLTAEDVATPGPYYLSHSTTTAERSEMEVSPQPSRDRSPTSSTHIMSGMKIESSRA
jgi:hypothetical protein